MQRREVDAGVVEPGAVARPGGVGEGRGERARGPRLGPAGLGIPDRQLAGDNAIDHARRALGEIVGGAHPHREQGDVAERGRVLEEGLEPAPVDDMAGAGIAALVVGAPDPHLVAPGSDGVAVALALRRVLGRGHGLGGDRNPAARVLTVVVDGPGLDLPGDGAGLEAAVVGRVVEPARHHHIDTDPGRPRAGRVGGERADPAVLACLAVIDTDQLLAGDLGCRHDVGLEQGDGGAGRHELGLDLLEGGDRRVLDADLLDLVLALADAMQLVQVLLVVLVLGPGRGGEIGIDPVAAVDHGNRLGEARLVALGLQRIGRARRGHALAEARRGGLGRRQQDIDQRRADQGNAGGDQRDADRGSDADGARDEPAEIGRGDHHGEHEDGAERVLTAPTAALG